MLVRRRSCCLQVIGRMLKVFLVLAFFFSLIPLLLLPPLFPFHPLSPQLLHLSCHEHKHEATTRKFQTIKRFHAKKNYGNIKQKNLQVICSKAHMKSPSLKYGVYEDTTNVGPMRGLCRHRCLLPCMIIRVQSPGPMWWEEKNNSYKLASDLHICTM